MSSENSGWRPSPSNRRSGYGPNGSASNNQNWQQSSSPRLGSNNSNNTGYFSDHVPVNGYNAREVEDMLTRSHEQYKNLATNPQVPEAERPAVYKADTKGWSTPKGSGGGGAAWGARPGALAGGGSLLGALRKAAAAAAQEGN